MPRGLVSEMRDAHDASVAYLMAMWEHPVTHAPATPR